MANRRMHHKKHAGTARTPAHPRGGYGAMPQPPDISGKSKAGAAKGRKKRLAGMMI